jgi:hypothetical protein
VSFTGRHFFNLIKPLRMLRDGGNADEENQDADDIGLEPQDMIGVHGKRSNMGSLQDFPVTGVSRVAGAPTLASPLIPRDRRHRAAHRNF